MPAQRQRFSTAGERNNTPDRMKILSAETYDDEAAVSIARSLTELAQQRPDAPPYLFGLSGGFEVITEKRSDTPQLKVEEKGAKARKTRKTRRANPSDDEDVGLRKKKQKLSEDEDGDEDESSKKARGRPRLDTKDETAADRRRTQIRLAQRAYRHRKETTIASLEAQVEKLQNTTEEMNSMFISLYDVAASQGLLQREPEFAQHLQTATRRVLALVKAATSDDSSRDDDSSPPEEGKPSDRDAVVKADFKRPTQPPTPVEEVVPALSKSTWEHQSPVDHNPYDLQRYDNHIPLSNQQSLEQGVTSQSSFFGGEFIDMTDVDLHQMRAEVSDTNTPYQFNTGLSNDQSLFKTPISFASFETSFGRRLHRTARERGFRLLMDPNTSPRILSRVFGFSLLFRTKDQILASVKNTLERSTTKDLLNNWKAPFVHLGGSGTYYPLPEEDLASNQMPKLKTGRSMGPFTPEAMSAKEKYMIDNFNCNFEGFEGKYFDANDVESYLRSKGVDIPPNMEYVTINLDMVTLDNLPAQTSVSLSTVSSNSDTISPSTPLGANIMGTSNGDQITTRTFDEIMEDIQQLDDFTGGSGYQDPSTSGYEGTFSNWAITPTENVINNNKLSPAPNAFDLSGPIFNASSVRQALNSYDGGWDSSSSSDSTRLVTLSIATLVQNISNRGVCLGRAPGFRPRDVDVALRRTILEAQ